MQLGTVWNDCQVIYLDGDFRPVAGMPRVEQKWEAYRRSFPASRGYTGWFDTQTGSCFSGAQFRSGCVQRDYHFNDDTSKFLLRTWGRQFVRDRIAKSEVFRRQSITFDDECIHGHPPWLSRYRDRSILIVLGGPTANAVDWSALETDFLWSCNAFYKHPKLRAGRADLVALSSNISLFENPELDAYLRNHDPAILFEVQRTNDWEAWRETTQFVDRHEGRTSFFHTRYSSLLGIGARLICYAILLGARDVYFVGLDGMSKAGPQHAFEPKKENPSWFSEAGEDVQRRQFIVFWDYILGLSSRLGCNLYNLGEGQAFNVSTAISELECPLGEALEATVGISSPSPRPLLEAHSA